MSVHREGKRYRVKWRDHNGEQQSQTFSRKTDADAHDGAVRRAKQLGPHLMAELRRNTETLDDFIRGPWAIRAAKLGAKTKAKYRWMLRNHMGKLGDEPLVTLSVARLEEHQQHLLDNGVAPNTVRELFAMLAAILEVATRYGRIPANPVRSVDKVDRTPREPVAPFTPVELEQMVAGATGRDLAVLALGGHLGLRPIEIRSCPWSRWDGDHFRVEQVDTKPSAGPRGVYVPETTRTILRAWRLESGGRGTDPIIGPMNARNMNARNQWLRRISGRDDVTLYTLRHSHASALHYASFTLAEAAERMGHTQIVHVNHYNHVINGLGGQRWPDLDALIADARNPERSEMFRRSSAVGSES